MLREIYEFSYYFIYYSMIYAFPIAFFFFLALTVAMRDRDSKLKFREIMQSFFKKMF